MATQLFFQFYPTLLNEYHRYLNSTDKVKAKQQLLDRINRVRIKDPSLLAKFRKGVSFESAVVNDKPTTIDAALIEKARRLLPLKAKAQHYIEFTHKNIRFYGYADIVGEGKVIDLKSTAYHKPGRHDFNFQNLYLFALRDFGFTEMEYVICDFKEVYLESYRLSNYDFKAMLSEMESFRDFLIVNRSLITDKKVIIEKDKVLFSF